MKPEHTLSLYRIETNKYPDNLARVSVLDFAGQVTSEKVDVTCPEGFGLEVSQPQNGQFEVRWEDAASRMGESCDVKFHVYTTSGRQDLTSKVLADQD